MLMGSSLAAAAVLVSTCASAQRTDDGAAPSPARSDFGGPTSGSVGVNLAGGEFGSVPGVFQKDYTYPGVRQFDYCQRKGLRVVRLPIRWERVQPMLMEPLDETEMDRLDRVVELARQRDIGLLVDLHNYARYNGSVIGTDDVPVAAFADFWRRLARHYRDEPAVFAYGLMNEPHRTQGRWPAAAQAGVDAIRSVDRKHTISVCGDGFSGAHSWKKINNDFLLNDPVDNLLYEAHQYFDCDNSGRYRRSYDESGSHPMIGVDRLRPFVEWLNEHETRGFIGEFGVPDNDPRWLVVLDNFLAAMKEHHIGGTYWAAGPWWGQYPLSVEPRDGRDRPQMAVIEHYAGAGRQADKPWLPAAAAAEKAARDLERLGGRMLHDFGARKESYHYSNEGSEFHSTSAVDGGRSIREITYRHRGRIAWVGFGLYFGQLDCTRYAAFRLKIRSERPCRLEIKAYPSEDQPYVGTFEVNMPWQELHIPFSKLVREGKHFDASRKLVKIEFQPGRVDDGNRIRPPPK